MSPPPQQGKAIEQHVKILALLALVLVAFGIKSGHGAICHPIPIPLQYSMAPSLVVPQQVATSLLGFSVSDDLPVFSGHLECVSAGAMGDPNAEPLHVDEVT